MQSGAALIAVQPETAESSSVHATLQRALRTVKQPQAQAVRIVVLYDDFAAGLQAKDLLDRLQIALKIKSGYEYRLWKLSVLDLPDLAAAALSDALQSHVLMFCCHGAELSPGAIRWIDRVLLDRTNGPEALAVFGDPRPSEAVCAHLRRIAGLAGMEYFHGAASLSRSEDPFSSPHLRERTKAGVLNAAFASSERRMRTECRHWGINE